ncbi:rho-associated protein kinase 1-like [Microplitis mediator]|uniref:rho-associated protein kinase 1-like n=1 Tax=Microplitis mediator TaxID=375433 RepID=UPI002553628A|nr:rho-associated protein kinase 1-like [Microplitis mediator]
MDTASDESDIDIDKVSELVENLEELDNNLFGDNRQKKSLFGIEKTKQNVKETQKKVIFRDFDDDPLDDLLGDSNTLNKNKFSNKNDDKISGLFGIKNTEKLKSDVGISKSTEFNFTSSKNEEKKSLNDNWKINKSQSATSQPKVSKTFENSNNELIISSKSSLPDRTKKSLIMEDLFGSKSRASSTNENSHDKSMSKNFGSEEIISSSKPAQFTLSTSSGREPRRARPKSINLNDTLGLLDSQEQITQTKQEYLEQKAASINDIPPENLPAWLGGTKKITTETDKQVNNPTAKSDKCDVQNNIISKSSILNQDNLSQRNTISLPDISSLTGTQFDPKISIVAMQQQEHELRAATILSQQTDQLSSIVEGQKSKLNEQEKLFDTLIKQQIDRQSILETQIKLQQARIDHYIQALSNQHMTLPSGLQFENKDKDPMTDKQNDEKISSEYLSHTLEVEKHNLEHLVDIMKDTNEREVKILQDSHETQMRLMQENLNKLEERLRGQIAEIQNEYEKKIEKLSTEKNEQEIYLKTQIENLKTDQIQVIKDIHIRHSQQVDLLQKEHIKTLENISRAKKTEQQTVDFIITHKTDVNSILERVQHVSDGFQTLSDQIKNRDLDSVIKRESNLKRQEESLKVLIEHLITQQETMDSERKQLVNIAQKLESDTNELTNQFVTSHKLINERETRLEMQEKSFIHERNLFHEQIKWEREHIQCLKETWITEQKQQLKLLANEREAVAAERAKFEVFNNLKLNSDDLIKTELEAAIKAAHDATHQANLERQRWQEKSESLLTEQRRNEMKERQLMQRAKDLEELTQAAVIKREEGLQALREAQRIEKQHKDKLNQLQSQLESLADRESKIAAEKITLARERLSLRVYQVEKSEKDITNDSYHNQVKESTYMSPAPVQTHFKDIVDPQLLLLKLNLDNKLDTSQQLLTDMQELI